MALVPIPLRSWNAIIPDLAREILTDRLTARLRLRGVYPVIFSGEVENTIWAGWCPNCFDAPDGEVHLAPRTATTPGTLLNVYLHELAHRLIGAVESDFLNPAHAWPFAIMYAVLLRRAEGHIPGVPRIHALKCYDVYDEDEANWGWALQRALDISAELAPLPISAEECAEKIWRIWFDEKEGR